MRSNWVLSLVVCCVVAFVAGNRLDAAGAVYLTATPASSNSSIIHQAGIGEALNLECDLYAASICEWDVSVWYDNFDGGAFGWGLDFGLLDLQQFAHFSVSNVQIPLNEITTFVGPYQTNLPNGLLIENANGSNLRPAGAGPALWEIMSFRLTQSNAAQDIGTVSVHAGYGASEFGGNDPQGFDFYEIVAVGPNAPHVGYNPGPWPYNVYPNAVLTVSNVPEPTALALVGIGGLVILRRGNRRA